MRAFAVVFAVAVGVRLMLLVSAWDSPFLVVPLVDAHDVHLKAIAIAGGDGHPPQPFDRPPLLTYVAAAVYRLFGMDMRNMVIAHLALGVLTAVLTARLAARFVPRPVAVAGVAGSLFALSRLPLFVELQLLNEPLQVALMVIAVSAAIDAHDRRCGRLFLVASMATGLAVLARPTSIVPLGAVLMWAAGHRRVPAARRIGWRSVITGTVLIAMMVAGVTIRNRVVGGEWVPISYNGGINFFIGNAKNHDALQNVRPGLQWERLVRNPRALEETNVFHLDPWREGARGWDARFVRAAWEDIMADPAAALARVLRKSAQFWSAAEVDRNLSPAIFFLPHSGRWWVTLPFWLIGPLGLAGLILLAVDRHRLALPLWLWTGGAAATCVIFFVTSRYRAPVYPALAISGAYLLWRIVSGRRLVPLALLAGAALFAALDPGGARRIAPARETFLTGLVWERSGEPARALTYYEAARVEWPVDPDVLFQPTALYLTSGRPDVAAEWAEAAVAQIPDHPSPLFNLGLARSALGEGEAALAAFERLVAVSPLDARYQYQLGRARLSQGDANGSLTAFKRAAAAAPGAPFPWTGMADAYEKLGRASEATRARAEAARRSGPR